MAFNIMHIVIPDRDAHNVEGGTNHACRKRCGFPIQLARCVPQVPVQGIDIASGPVGRWRCSVRHGEGACALHVWQRMPLI